MTAGPRAVLQTGAAGQGCHMPVLRAAARPMMASIFIVQGFDTMLHPERKTSAAKPVVRPIAERVSVIPNQTEQAVRLSGAVQLLSLIHI